jgi:endo-1,4-beta-xylanase
VADLDVIAEGRPASTSVGVFREVGKFAGMAKPFHVASDSLLELTFRHVVEAPAIKAIEIPGDDGRARELWVGAAVAHQPLMTEPQYAAMLAAQFNYLTPENEMKWGPIHPEPDRFNFAPADDIVDFAEAHAMRVKGHALVWHSQLPPWVESLSADELRAAMAEHIRAVVGRYRGRAVAWDVVNEAVTDAGGPLRDTVFLRQIGAGYIAQAFRIAHEADPDALLFYNDYGAEGLGGKSDRVFELVRNLVAQGVPIHGVGLQMHIRADVYPTPEQIRANIRRLAELGLLVTISEMDVQVRMLPGDRAARLAAQRRVYRDVVGACVAEPGCHAVTFWGFTDAHSWIDEFAGSDDPLLFDESLAPKPAYFGVIDALLALRRERDPRLVWFDPSP